MSGRYYAQLITAGVEGDDGAALGGNNPIEVDMNSGSCRFISLMEVLDYMDRGLVQ
jgi:hypothetical protein